MNDIPAQRSILVVDPDADFLEKIKNTQLKQPKTPEDLIPLTAGHAREAQKALLNQNEKIMAIAYNPLVDRPVGISLIRTCKLIRPCTPIYIIYDDELPFSSREKSILGINEFIKKPIHFDELSQKIFPNIIPSIAKMNPMSQPSEPGSTLAGEERALSPSPKETAHFIPVPVEFFIAGCPSIFDIYYAMPSGKFLKILSANHSFDLTQLESYTRKNLTHFYISRDSQNRYLAYCDQIAKKIIADDRFTIETKIHLTAMHGEATMSFLKSRGVSEDALQFSANYVNNVETLIKSKFFIHNPIFGDFFKDIAKYEHGVSTSIISCLLAMSLGFDKIRSVQTVGVASFLHDIGLMKMSTNLFDDEDNEDTLTEEQRKEYQTHPTISANLLGQIPTIDPVVLQAVAQHHERRTRKGFPAQLGPGAINRIGEIIGISNEFLRLIRLASDKVFLDVYQEMETKIFNGFSFEVTQAFQSAFFPGKK